MTSPVPGFKITTPYGKTGGSWGCGRHDGVDFAAPTGTAVVAAWSGIVVEAAYPTSFGSSFGLAVVIDHDHVPDGRAGGWGIYCHLSAESVVVGQRVKAGQRIGDVGTTGNSTGLHLHFGVYETPYWVSCGGIDPQPWIDAGAGEEAVDMAARLVAFFQHKGAIYEASIAAGTFYGVQNPQDLTDRKHVLTQLGVPWVDWTPGRDVANIEAFGRRVG